MKTIFLGLTLLLVASAAAQAENIQIKIDSTLWKPFQSAFENNDGQALNALYAEEVLRVTPSGIDTENRFKEANLKRFEANRTNNTQVRLDFWFDSRKTNAQTSYEVGLYRMRLSDSSGQKTIFGQFHIVLQYVEGTWKITQDWDTTTINGKDITATDFEKQRPMVFE